MEAKPVPVLTEQALQQHAGVSDDESSSSHFDEEGRDSGKKGSAFGPDESAHDNDSNSSSDDIAKTESRVLRNSKVCVFIFLLICAFSIAITAWFLFRREEEDNFESDFITYADQLVSVAEDNTLKIFREIEKFSSTITSRALDQNLQFPLVTIPHYNIKSKELAFLAGTETIMYAPILPFENETTWEQWFIENQSQVMFDTFGASGAFLDDPVTDIYPIPEEAYSDYNLSLLNSTFMVPVLQYGPDANSSGLLKMDLNTHPVLIRAISDCVVVAHSMLSEVFDTDFLHEYTYSSDVESPKSIIAEPVFDSFDSLRKVAGFVMFVEPWNEFFGDTLPIEAQGFVVTVLTTCGEAMTYNVQNGTLVYIGMGDLHDSRYNSLNVRAEFANFSRYDGPYDGLLHCNFSIVVYPSRSFEDEYYTNEPYLFAMMLLIVFLATVALFVAYDFFVSREQRKVEDAAKRATDIVKSLFPKQVGDRLIAEAQEKAVDETKNTKQKRLDVFLARNEMLEAENAASEGRFRSEPIAEFYTDTTIMFADIVGFTAWSSMREPKHVFKLLETIYRDYDQKASRRGVFKVETIGDCYVAVCGLPQPRKDHYVAMARFARDCVVGFSVITRQLGETLGPDTSDLATRVGLHSGPVTAGVLRGDRARFQLFGDTMNTASRMESKGKANMIHISQETADLLAASGKAHWFSKREDLIVAKGKGQLQTYWLNLTDEKARSATSAEKSAGKAADVSALVDVPTQVVRREIESRDERLVKWNADILAKLLGSILGRRKVSLVAAEPEGRVFLLEKEMVSRKGGALPELKEVIEFPPVCAHDAVPVEVPEKVKEQLYAYIKTLASMHRENPFHSFEHGSHVMMALMKLFSRVGKSSENASLALLVDPTTQFAAALSTLMAGVDNQGVPNTQLTKEHANVAVVYGNTCVSEQNALDLSWSLLMSPEYSSLRRAIYTTKSELQRFRQLVVNSVLTNSKELLARRKILWQTNFGDVDPKDPQGDLRDRKATILLESLVQAASASHAMQHWQIFLKWNTRLFEEALLAHKQGRADYDPGEFWYDTEIGTFDNIVLPLAKNLKESEVLGASGDEYLGFAMRNRREWVTRGKQIMEEMKQTLQVEAPEKEEEKPMHTPNVEMPEKNEEKPAPAEKE